jgi:hypothetical protein
VQALVMLCVSLYIVAGIGVGVRLLRIAFRTRGIPEAALGATLFCFAALSQPAAILGEIAKQQGELGTSGVAGIVSWFGTFAALAGLAVFTWQTFRPGERWAAALALGAIALDALAIGSLVRNLQLGVVDPAANGPAIAASCVVFAVIFGWGALEGLQAWSAARKRERLGLADAAVTNRFLLWSVSSLGGFVADVLLIPLVLSGADLTKDPAPQLAVAASALLNAVCWFLAFAPPPVYRRWMAGRMARA